jgi:predicted Na+-dependent transporter
MQKVKISIYIKFFFFFFFFFIVVAMWFLSKPCFVKKLKNVEWLLVYYSLSMGFSFRSCDFLDLLRVDF